MHKLLTGVGIIAVLVAVLVFAVVARGDDALDPADYSGCITPDDLATAILENDVSVSAADSAVMTSHVVKPRVKAIYIAGRLGVTADQLESMAELQIRTVTVISSGIEVQIPTQHVAMVDADGCVYHGGPVPWQVLLDLGTRYDMLPSGGYIPITWSPGIISPFGIPFVINKGWGGIKREYDI